MGHQLIRDLRGEVTVETAGYVDPGQLGALSVGSSRELTALASQIGALGIGLGADRDILPRGHGEGAGREPGDRGEQHGAVAGGSRRDSDDQTTGGDQAIVGTEHGRAEPPDTPASVQLAVPRQSSHWRAWMPTNAWRLAPQPGGRSGPTPEPRIGTPGRPGSRLRRRQTTPCPTTAVMPSKRL